MRCFSRGIRAKNTPTIGTCMVLGVSALCVSLPYSVLILWVGGGPAYGERGRHLRKPTMTLMALVRRQT